MNTWRYKGAGPRAWLWKQEGKMHPNLRNTHWVWERQTLPWWASCPPTQDLIAQVPSVSPQQGLQCRSTSRSAWEPCWTVSPFVGRIGCVWADFFVGTVLCAGWRWDANSGEKAAKWEESGGLAGARCTPCTRHFSRAMCYYQYTMICTATSVSLLHVAVGYSLTETILLKARQCKMETVDWRWRAVGRLSPMRRIPWSAPASNHWVCSSSPHGTPGLQYYIRPGISRFARPERGIGTARWPYRHHTSIYEYCCTRNHHSLVQIERRKFIPGPSPRRFFESDRDFWHVFYEPLRRPDVTFLFYSSAWFFVSNSIWEIWTSVDQI